jgi:hypothetical protein
MVRATAKRTPRGKAGMFDRSSRAEGPLTDGRVPTGKFVVPPGRSLSEVLNSSSAFIEFESVNQKRTFIAKSALQSVEQLN